MSTPGGIAVELISCGPGVGWWSTPEQRESALEAEIARQIDDLRFRQAVDHLMAGEQKRSQSRIRRAKPVNIPAGKALLTVSDVAARLQVNRRTVERYIEEGALKASRIAGKGQFRIKESDLEKMLVSMVFTLGV